MLNGVAGLTGHAMHDWFHLQDQLLHWLEWQQAYSHYSFVVSRRLQDHIGALRFRLIGFAHMFLYFDDPEHDEALGKSITFRILFLNLRRQRFRTAGQHIPGTS